MGIEASQRSDIWRHAVLAVVAAVSLVLLLFLSPPGQNPGYHSFADQRAFLGIPNFLNVTSNVAFLLVGIAGVALLARRPMSSRAAWLTFWLGVAAISAGSGYYHADPNDQTLVWDRLPITLAFMGFLSAILGEYVSVRLGRVVLAPAVLAGLISVLYWHWFGDLRFYYWIQLIPLLMVPVVMILFRAPHTGRWLLLVAVGFYGLAKISELYDRDVFEMTGRLLSGHTAKHLLAALSCLAVLGMLWRRKPAQEPFARS
jgi:hypothetical protein